MSNRSVFNFLKNQSRRVLSTMVQAILVKIQVTGTEIWTVIMMFCCFQNSSVRRDSTPHLQLTMRMCSSPLHHSPVSMSCVFESRLALSISSEVSGISIDALTLLHFESLKLYFLIAEKTAVISIKLNICLYTSTAQGVELWDHCSWRCFSRNTFTRR